MQYTDPDIARHKAWLYRILSAIADDAYLTERIRFKGGTCATMLGWLDRFSVDLDFDFVGSEDELSETRRHMERIFEDIGLNVKDQSLRAPQYFLGYPAPKNERNTIKVDVAFPVPRTNTYEPQRLIDIDRILLCQSVGTMFANKLVALIDRHTKRETVAGRDVYDIHHFFERGFRYDEAVIRERTGKTVLRFFGELLSFIDREVTEEMLSQDLNVLVSYEKFRSIRRTLKRETMMFIRDEIGRLEAEEKVGI